MAGAVAVAREGSSGTVTPVEGAEKALLLLVSIDESVATRVLSHLGPEEVLALRHASEKLTEIDPRVLLQVHKEFVARMRQGMPASLKGSGAYLRRLAGKALGEGRVAELWEERREVKGPFARLAEMEPSAVMSLLERERPQTLAVVFSMLEPSKARELLLRFPLGVQAEIVARMAKLDSLPREVVQEIERQFADEVEALGDPSRAKIPGLETAVAILKRFGEEEAQALFGELQGRDEALVETLQNQMFTFEDLLRVDAKGIQQLLKEIQTDQLVLALKSASEEMREKIFGNLSSRAAAAIREELEYLGPVRVADVEAAQRAIVEVALRLEKEGVIQIAREGANDYV